LIWKVYLVFIHCSLFILTLPSSSPTKNFDTVKVTFLYYSYVVLPYMEKDFDPAKLVPKEGL
jgi:hypothetical protein